MLDREYPSQLRARAKSWWVFTILSVIAIVCVSCSSAPQQTSSSRGRTVQSPRVTVAVGMPLTDSAPPQLDVTPTVSASRSPTPATMISLAGPTSYEAESPQNTLADGAEVSRCSGCSGGANVSNLGLHDGSDGTLQFNNVSKKSAGTYTLTIYYLNAESNRSLYMSLDGGSLIALTASGTGSRTAIAALTVAVALNAGNNTIEFSNPSDPAPDIDRIVV
jgi:hypothetical protein